VSTGYSNSCDSRDVCSNTRSTSPYNSCVDPAGKCGNESISQCDGTDNDCDGIYDNGLGMECKKDTILGGANYWGGDCNSSCKICQGNKITALTFKSKTNGNNDSNTYNYLDKSTEFVVDLNALSPNSCVVSYNFQLLYSANGTDWNIVDNNLGMGINNFKDSAIGVLFEDSIENKINKFSFSQLESTPFSNKLNFASGSACVANSDCNTSLNEVCRDSNKCCGLPYSSKCNDSNQIEIYDSCGVVANSALAVTDCNLVSGCFVDVNNGDHSSCSPLKTNVCGLGFNSIFNFDSNGQYFSKHDCNQLNDEQCIDGACCKITKTCQGNSVRTVSSCGGTDEIVACASGETCVGGFCCAATGTTFCSGDLTKIQTRNTCGIISDVQICNPLLNQTCRDGNACCSDTTNYTCGVGFDSNTRYMVDSCGVKRIAEVCSSGNACVSGSCCLQNFNRVCSADKNYVNVYDSCGNLTVEQCGAGNSCTNGTCGAIYNPGVGQGTRKVVTTNLSHSFVFNARYLPVGYKYKIAVQVVDSKTRKNVSGAVYGDNNWFYSNIITVRNTIPSVPAVSLTRVGFYGDTNLECTTNSSVDPDVFPLYKASQILNYFGRIYEDGTATGAFVPTVPPTGGKVKIVLDRERAFCCDSLVTDNLDFRLNSTCSSAFICGSALGQKPIDGNTILGKPNYDGSSTLKDWNFKLVPENLLPCEWSCKVGYVHDGNTCNLTGVLPPDSNVCLDGQPAGIGQVDSGVLASTALPYPSKNWSYVPDKNAVDLNACQWSCASGYAKPIDNNSCSKIVSGGCLGSAPFGGVSQGVLTGRTDSPVFRDWNYVFDKNATDLNYCEWTCNRDYNKSGNTCTLIETPFIPTLADISFKAEFLGFEFLPDGTVQLSFSVSASKRIQSFSDNVSPSIVKINFASNDAPKISFDGSSGKISINKIQFKKSDSTIVSGHLVNSLGDVKEIPQPLFAVMDSNVLGNYTATLSYGGNFLGVDVNGTKEVSFALKESESKTIAIPDSNPLLVVLVLLSVIALIATRRK
jgi:hypothetical protein